MIHNLVLTTVNFFFFNDPATTEIYTLSLHDALPIFRRALHGENEPGANRHQGHHRQRINTDLQRSEEHTSELQSRLHLVCRLLLEKKKKKNNNTVNHQKHRKNIHRKTLNI